MTEQQNHLKSVVEQQRVLLNEIQELTNRLNNKKEVALKLQGIVEYLTEIGVTLPQEVPQPEADQPQEEQAAEEGQ
jgi:hypothetical protein